MTRSICLLGIVLLLFGCQSNDQLETAYGVRNSGGQPRSVNGTDVFAEMFRQAGHRVSTWRRLSPKLDGKRKREDEHNPKTAYDVIVWAPDRFDAPSEEAVDFLNEWVGNGGTLIFIGRDYDASIDYWNRVLPRVSPENVAAGMEQLAEAQSEFENRRLETPAPVITPWFVMEPGSPIQYVERLQGPWGTKIGQVQIRQQTRLKIPTDKQLGEYQSSLSNAELEIDSPENYEMVLSSDDQPVLLKVTHTEWKGQVLVAVNGSFLLNLPLVQTGNQQIATRLVEECGEPGRVAFLESGPGDLRVLSVEPGSDSLPKRREPLRTIVDHATILGIVICFAVLPIFGRAKEDRQETASDFGKHINAVGDLLARTRNLDYARDQLQHYQQHVDKGHREEPD